MRGTVRRRSQGQPRYPLHDVKPTRLRQRQSTWYRELGNLIGGVVLVIAAAHLLWRIVPR